MSRRTYYFLHYNINLNFTIFYLTHEHFYFIKSMLNAFQSETHPEFFFGRGELITNYFLIVVELCIYFKFCTIR